MLVVDDPIRRKASAYTTTIRVDPQSAEMQASIAQWADETFGKCDEARAFQRMLEEMEELRDAPPEKRARECADVLIAMIRYAEVADFDLGAEVVTKMQINRKRKWNVQGDGTGYRVKDENGEDVLKEDPK